MNELFTANIHEEIMREYEQIREKNLTVQRETKRHIYSRFPEIAEIDDRLNKVALNTCKKILENNVQPEKLAEEMQKEIEKLISRKNEILNSVGLSPECLAESYSCNKCKDTGWDGNEHCSCYAKKMQKVMQKRANIGSERMHTFREFDINKYSEATDSEYKVSPRKNAKNILDTAKRYSKCNDEISRQLLLYGGTGLGKTFTSECIASEFIKNGKSVFYTSAPKLFSIFEDYKFGRNISAEAKKLIDCVSDVDLLIIDDLGTEFRTQYIDSILFDILNTRISRNMYLIISTNLKPDQFETTYSPRISSRILGHFETVTFFGNDIRMNK